jgi:F0F1-type ATP synthase assembly protein I
MPKDNVTQQIGKYYSVVFILPAAVLVGFVLGYLLDKAFGTGFLKIVFLFLGLASGMIELIRELNKVDGGK